MTMHLTKPLTIDPNETFPALPRAPIVEAVIGIRAQAGPDWTEEALQAKVKAKLPEYPEAESQREIQIEAMFEAGRLPSQRQRDTWRGLKFTSANKCQIAQFNRDGFSFSRLPPYQDWDRFRDEAVRL